MKNTKNININIIKKKGMYKTTYMEYHLLLILNHNLRVRIKDNNYYLNEKDIILFLPGDEVQYFYGQRCMILDIAFNTAFFESCIPVYKGIFICNSAIDHQHDYNALRNSMAQMTLAYMKETDISDIYFQSLLYLVMYNLMSNHFEKSLVDIQNGDEKYTDRMNKIMLYIQENFANDLNLNDLAVTLQLSTSYLSRFFKRAFHDNFINYIKKYRLEQSKHEILYTNYSITEIAMRCGFNNVNSYIQDFKSYYKLTPGNYRRHYGLQSVSKSFYIVERKKDETAISVLKSFSDEREASLQDCSELNEQWHFIIDTKGHGKLIKPIWKTGIGIAAADNMPFNDISKEIMEIQRDVQFIYGRISFLMSNNFIYDVDGEKFNFYYFTRMIQELKNYHLIPYLDINYNCTTLNENKKMYYIDTQYFLKYLESLLLYSANVFGIAELEQWIFDIGMVFNFNTLITEDVNIFVDRFVSAYKLIKKIIPRAKVGGFDICSVFMENYCYEIINKLLDKGIIPDFISVNLFPYLYYENENGSKYFYNNDDAFPSNVVNKFKKIINSCYKSQSKLPEFFVSAIGTTIIHRNYINDTCYQSNFIARTIIQLIGKVDLLCYYQLSDMNFSSHENQNLLKGRNGLISQFGIHKPGYLVFQMMSGLSDNLLDKGDYYMVTKGKHHTYNIMVYNPVKILDAYCLKIEENTSLADAYTIYEPDGSRSVFFTLNHITNGMYRIISYHVNRENGSLFDEWEKTGFWENSGIHELNYLKQAIHPKRNCSQRKTTNGQLNFHMNLLPFEVILIEISLIVDDQCGE